VTDVNAPTLVALLERLWRRMKVELADASGRHAPGMRPSQVRVLSLTPTEGARVGDLAARVGMTAQSLGEVVDALTRTGHLEVVRDPADRRARLVRPTTAGRAVARAMAEEIGRFEERLRREVDPSEFVTFRAVLTALGRERLGGEEPSVSRSA
jgi:DNA-binding MarR family transcriptional regulator